MMLMALTRLVFSTGGLGIISGVNEIMMKHIKKVPNLLLTDSSRTLKALSLQFLGRPGTENPMLSSFSFALLSAL